MIAGIPERFAIEAEPRDAANGWIWGGFRFWIGSLAVGNWDDATALHLCWGWLRKFYSQPQECTEPVVASSSVENVFRLIVDPVFGLDGVADPAKQPIPFAYERFHISYLGMSSFDSFVVLLVKDVVGNERCLWKKSTCGTIREQWLHPGEVERVAEEFCGRFAAQYLGALGTGPV